MRKILYFLVIAFSPFITIGQVVEKQTNEGDQMMTDSIKSIIPIAKQSLLKNVDVIFNSRFAYDSKYIDGDHDYSSFNINQLRFEMKGKIHEKVYFRFRNRYTKEVEPGTIDHMTKSADLAFVRFDLSPRTNFSFGKLCADWGGFEFDFNPIDILEYNDIIENADNFLVGAGVSHTAKGGNHSFSFQILNSRTNTFEDQYGAQAPPELNASRYPLATVANWRGSFFKGHFQTTYSYSFFNEAEGAYMKYTVLGNKLNLGNNFQIYYDFQYSEEGLDRTGIITRIVDTGVAVRDTRYIENWIRAEWLVAPQVNLLMTVMNSNHYWDGNPDASVDHKLSTSYGLIPTIQYMPYKDLNLKFYLGYVYRKYDFTDYAKTAYGVSDYFTNRFSFGIIAPLLVL